MGQLFDRQYAEPTTHNDHQGKQSPAIHSFIPSFILILVTKISDISQLPPELALQILKNLNATDLCLANDEILWLG